MAVISPKSLMRCAEGSMHLTIWNDVTRNYLNKKAKIEGRRFGRAITWGVYIMQSDKDPPTVFRAGAIGVNRKARLPDQIKAKKGNDAAARFDQYQQPNKERPDALPWKYLPWRYVFGVTMLGNVTVGQVTTAEGLLHHHLSRNCSSLLGSSCYEFADKQEAILIGRCVVTLMVTHGPALFREKEVILTPDITK